MMFLKKNGNDVNLFDEFSNVFNMARNGFMASDIVEDKDGYVLTVDVPGVTKDDIKLSFDGDNLHVEVSKTSCETDKTYIKKERFTEEASRTYYLKDVDAAHVKAKLTDGVLTISLPKKVAEEPKKNYIEIE